MLGISWIDGDMIAHAAASCSLKLKGRRRPNFSIATFGCSRLNDYLLSGEMGFRLAAENIVLSLPRSDREGSFAIAVEAEPIL